MITDKNIQDVDRRIRECLDSAYEVFEREGSVYVNAPRDETEGESLDSPTCVYVQEVGFFADEDELYSCCVHATIKVDLIVEELILNGEW